MNADGDVTRLAPWIGAAALAGFAVIGVAMRHPHAFAISIPAMLVVIGAGAALVRFSQRRSWLLAILVVSGAAIAVLGAGRSSNVGWFGLVVLICWAVLAGGSRLGAVCWAASVALLAGEWVWASNDPGWAAWMAGMTCSAVGCGLGAHYRSLVMQLQAAQAGLAERSRVQERGRIARELHDVIAHSLTVSLLHVSSARLAVEHDPTDAVRSLSEAERLGRESLDEVRSIMGVLRAEGDSGTAPPVPGASAIPELVERFRAAGAAVELDMPGELTTLPATAGTTVYRILQEALTNALKHAHGAAVTVVLRDGGGRVELIVDSAGPPGHGAGMGIGTMRERAESVGGSCEAGPAGDGWRVRASLPTPRVGR